MNYNKMFLIFHFNSPNATWYNSPTDLDVSSFCFCVSAICPRLEQFEQQSKQYCITIQSRKPMSLSPY